MTPRARHRLRMIVFLGVGLSLSAGLVLMALRDRVTFFYTPSELLEAPPSQRVVRLGGLIEKGSVNRSPDGLAWIFYVTDGNTRVRVLYHGIVPDLFREGQGVVAEGYLTNDRLFHAKTLLAKHDENYMPPAVKRALDQKRERGP